MCDGEKCNNVFCNELNQAVCICNHGETLAKCTCPVNCTGGSPVCCNGFNYECPKAYSPRCVLGTAACLNESKNPQIVNGSCAKNQSTSQPEVATLPLPAPIPATTPEDKINSITISEKPGNKKGEVILSPTLPYSPNLEIDSTNKFSAYSGSNPAFEILLPDGEVYTDIVSLEIENKKQKISAIIPFKSIGIKQDSSKAILIIQIPKETVLGSSNLKITLKDKSTLTLPINILEPVNILKIKGGKKIKLKKPAIKKFLLKEEKNNLRFQLRGKNLIGTRFYLHKRNSNIHIESKTGLPYTTVTIFPSDLGLKANNITISKNGNILSARLSSSRKTSKHEILVISIATPKGIISHEVHFK